MLRLVASGVLLLPAAVVMIVTMPVVALLSLPAAALLTFRKKTSSTNKGTSFRRAIVTGGSSGIGLAVAHECVKKGFDQVVIIARNVEKLKAAQASLEKVVSKGKDTKVLALSVDVSSLTKLEEAATKIFANDADTSSTYLFCCAGQALARRFCDLSEDMILLNAKTNQLGATFAVRALLPHMKEGTIMLCSSMAGQVGVFGYGAYSPTKFALFGLAQVLHMELCNSPINVCCAYPPDTDTPGYELENVGKPEETHLISEVAGLAKPEDVGRKMVKEALKPNPPFAVTFDFDAWILSNLTAGMGPTTVFSDLVAQIAAMGVFRVVSLFYLNYFWGMLRNFESKKKTVLGGKKVTKEYGATTTRADTDLTEKSD